MCCKCVWFMLIKLTQYVAQSYTVTNSYELGEIYQICHNATELSDFQKFSLKFKCIRAIYREFREARAIARARACTRAKCFRRALCRTRKMSTSHWTFLKISYISNIFSATVCELVIARNNGRSVFINRDEFVFQCHHTIFIVHLDR